VGADELDRKRSKHDRFLAPQHAGDAVATCRDDDGGIMRAKRLCAIHQSSRGVDQIVNTRNLLVFGEFILLG